MVHERVCQYSCISLHTGTGNDAHGMYRDFGFIDGLLARNFTKALALETHHRSNKRCIAGRPFKQMRGSTVTRKNDDIETEPLASIDGLDFKNTGPQVGTVQIWNVSVNWESL